MKQGASTGQPGRWSMQQKLTSAKFQWVSEQKGALGWRLKEAGVWRWLKKSSQVWVCNRCRELALQGKWILKLLLQGAVRGDWGTCRREIKCLDWMTKNFCYDWERGSDTAKGADKEKFLSVALWLDMRKAKLCLLRTKKSNCNNYCMKWWEPGIWVKRRFTKIKLES